MEGFVEFIVELLFEIFGGIGELLVPDNVSKKKKKALMCLFAIIGLFFGMLLVVGVYLNITAKNRIIGIVLFGIGLLYFALAVSFYIKNKKR